MLEGVKNNDIYIMKRKIVYEEFKMGFDEMMKIYKNDDNDSWYITETNKVDELKKKELKNIKSG